jgi:hypothetical protein
LSLEETIARLQETIIGLGQQLETGSLQLGEARRITVTLATKLSIVTFFEHVSSGCLTEAFANVSDDVTCFVIFFSKSCFFVSSTGQMVGSRREITKCDKETNDGANGKFN